MRADLDDTIVALASAFGPGCRAIVRLSGPAALPITQKVFRGREPIDCRVRRCYPGAIEVRDLLAPLPADLYYWPAPRTYTGQEIVELHTMGCPPLLDLALAELLNNGARAARPGEFTLRAFLAGKLDLTQAEAVLAVIDASDREDLRAALRQLAGGVQRPLAVLRDRLLNLLADLEAGLDFADEDLTFIQRDDVHRIMETALEQLSLLQNQLLDRGRSDQAFRVVLVGRPNAGKSSLFNALTTGTGALVSSVPGTTRDYLVRPLPGSPAPVDLVDTAGQAEAVAASPEGQAQRFAQEQTERADLLLLCLDAGQPSHPWERALASREGVPPVVCVATKCDLAAPAAGWLATSCVAHAGIEALRALIIRRAEESRAGSLALSLGRCGHHLAAAERYLREALRAAGPEESTEVIALDVRGALEELGEMTGAIYTEDLLDRIFNRFCIGK
jgi:tRNA modification GTPase